MSRAQAVFFSYTHFSLARLVATAIIITNRRAMRAQCCIVPHTTYARTPVYAKKKGKFLVFDFLQTPRNSSPTRPKKDRKVLFYSRAVCDYLRVERQKKSNKRPIVYQEEPRGIVESARPINNSICSFHSPSSPSRSTYRDNRFTLIFPRMKVRDGLVQVSLVFLSLVPSILGQPRSPPARGLPTGSRSIGN